MTTLPIHMKTPRAKIDVSALTCRPVNAGFQATWLKNQDGVSQGPGWDLAHCGSHCWYSPGCDNCYWQAVRDWQEKIGEPMEGTYPLVENLQQPFRWKTRKNVFVCPQGDLFHKDIPNEFILEVVEVMAQCPQHNFILPTKRTKRLKLLNQVEGLSNVFIGVSIESQEYVRRAESLLYLPAGFRKVILAAPMLTPLVFEDEVLEDIDWMICSPERGGEGRTPRPCPEEWIMDLVQQVKKYKLPIFVDLKYQEERIYRMGSRFMEVPACLMR